MKKFFLPCLLCVLSFLSGCGGEGPDAQYFQFKANGKTVNLSHTVLGTTSSNGGIYSSIVTGFEGKENANVQMFSNRELVDSVYTQAGIPGQVPFGALMGYFNKKDQFFASALGNITIVVTEFSSEIIAGTFSGLLKSDSGDELEITEGEFRAKRQN